MDLNTYGAIKDAVTTVPGVKSLAKYQATNNEDLKTDNIQDAVEVIAAGNVNKVRVHVILMNGFNIRDVVNEVQIRVKYELEKLKQFTVNYFVDVIVDDLKMV